MMPSIAISVSTLVQPDGIVLNYLPHSSGIGYHYYYDSGTKYGNDETYGDTYHQDVETLELTTLEQEVNRKIASVKIFVTRGN